MGVGWVVWREKEDLPEDLIFRVNYLGGDMPTFALNFSRPGGQIVAYAMPANRHDLVIMRILVRHGVSRDLANLLLNNLKHCIAYFKKNPVTHKGSEKESGGFKHS